MSTTTDAVLPPPRQKTTTSTTDPPAEESQTLEIGDKCQVKWRDGSQQLLAKIIETRIKKKRKSQAEEIEYYVHYVHHDRRLDEWIDKSQFILETLEKAPKEETEGRKTRGAAHRVDTSTSSHRSSPTSDPTLAALEQEHEETTKVKNISKIYIG